MRVAVTLTHDFQHSIFNLRQTSIDSWIKEIPKEKKRMVIIGVGSDASNISPSSV